MLPTVAYVILGLSALVGAAGIAALIATCRWCLRKDKQQHEPVKDEDEESMLNQKTKKRGSKDSQFREDSDAKRTCWSSVRLKRDSGGGWKPLGKLRSAGDQSRAIRIGEPKRTFSVEGVQPGVRTARAASTQSLDQDVADSPDQAKRREDEASDIRRHTSTPTLPSPMADSQYLGKLQFSLTYDISTQTFSVRIMRAVDLPAKDYTGTSDPYVKVMLLPDKKYKMETKFKPKTLNPRWNETFLFEGFPFDKLISKTLYLQVFDHDRFSRDDPLGDVYMPLDNIDFSSTPTYWRELSPCQRSRGMLGELLLSLKYESMVGKIEIGVLKCKNLKARDLSGFSDPYVKMWLLYKNKRVEKKKTIIIKKNLNPVFNESFYFDVPLERLRDTSFLIVVMDYDKIGSNDRIGEIKIGPRASANEMKHWNDMIANPRQPVAQWHLLRDRAN